MQMGGHAECKGKKGQGWAGAGLTRRGWVTVTVSWVGAMMTTDDGQVSSLEMGMGMGTARANARAVRDGKGK